MADEEARRMGNRPDTAAAALAPGHGDTGAAGAHLAGQLVELEQALAGQGGGVHCGSGGHGCSGCSANR